MFMFIEMSAFTEIGFHVDFIFANIPAVVLLQTSVPGYRYIYRTMPIANTE